MKKLLHHIYNFFYLALHWNPLLAVFITWHEIRRGSKYGINTIKPESLKKFTIPDGDISKSSPYEAVNFYILEALLQNFRRLFPEEKNVLDAGCGKGRVLVAAAHFGFTHITGVDFAKELCEEAEKNIQKIKNNYPGTSFKVSWCDILSYSIQPEDRAFFLFNPFNHEILEKFAGRIEHSLRMHPRNTYFIYAAPKHISILLEKNYKIIYHIKKIKLLEGVILFRNTG